MGTLHWQLYIMIHIIMKMTLEQGANLVFHDFAVQPIVTRLAAIYIFKHSNFCLSSMRLSE